jgi:hypothetical protein
VWWFLQDSLALGHASSIATEKDSFFRAPLRLTRAWFNDSIIRLSHPKCSARSAEHARRYIAVRLLPFLCLLYIINYLDRTSVAYAAIGMARDPRFDDRVLGMGIGIFFASYVTLQIPGAALFEDGAYVG